MKIPGIYERRVSHSRCYETTTVRWFGRVTSKTQRYLGGKALRGHGAKAATEV